MRTFTAVFLWVGILLTCGAHGPLPIAHAWGGEGSLIQMTDPVPVAAPAPTGTQVQAYSYRSITPVGRPIDVNARLYLPPGTAPAGGWPLIAYGHGASGVVQHCPPAGYDPGLTPLLNSGFAVSYTNYQGLGGPGLHPFLESESQARDVLYAARAARAARNDLSNRVVLVGGSQGGRATEAAASLASLTPELRILGNAMGAPALRIDLTTGIDNHTLTAGQLVLLPYFVYGIQRRYPSLQYSSVMRGALLANAPAIVNTCSGDTEPQFAPLVSPVDTQFASATARTQLAEYLASGNLPWNPHPTIPDMITRGDSDTVVLPQWTASAVKAMCANGTRVFDQLRPGDHTDNPAIDISRIGSWVADRFAGRPASNNCFNTG